MAKVMFEFKDGGLPEQAAKDLGLTIEQDTMYLITKGNEHQEKKENVGVIVGLPGMASVKVIRISDNFPDILSRAKALSYLSEFSVKI